MVLLTAVQGLVAAEGASTVRQEQEAARRCSARYPVEGIEGLPNALFAATREFFDRMNRAFERTRSIIGKCPA